MRFIKQNLFRHNAESCLTLLSLIIGALSGRVSAQERSALDLKDVRQQITAALKNQKLAARSFTGTFEAQTTGKGKNKKETTTRSYEFGLNGKRYFLAILDFRMKPADENLTHRLEYVSDGSSFFNVVQGKSGGGYAMRQFESKPDQVLVDFHRFLADSNHYFMRGLPLLDALESDSFQFTKMETRQGEFGAEWLLDFKMNIQDVPFKTGRMTFYADHGFQLKNLSARPAAPFNAQLMAMEWEYRLDDQKELILVHATIEDVNLRQSLTFKEFKPGRPMPESRFQPDHFGLPDPRKVKTGMSVHRPLGYFLASYCIFGIGMRTRRMLRQESFRG